MKIYGQHDERTIQQLERCVEAEDGAIGVLCADGHLGYSMPIGGVVGYRKYVSPSGVGYDIACGNLAVQTNVMAKDLDAADMNRLADEIQRRISFGVGRKNNEPVKDDPEEVHDGGSFWVVRKGATPARPGQWGFVGGSMGDISVILRGVESAASAAALYSTVHGAGRVMSRTQAAGKQKWVRGEDGRKRPERVGKGLVDFDVEKANLDARGIVLRGAGADEAPPVYRPLQSVLDAHAGTIEVVHTLQPRIVVMAGGDEFDPYKD